MKILLVNPHDDAAHGISEIFSEVGAAVLLAKTTDEAWQMLQLHGKSVDLAVVHREGLHGPDDGLKFIERVHSDPAQADLPFVVTSSQWGDAEFARHQATPGGANAYVTWPCEPSALLGILSALFGDIGQQSVASALAKPEPERATAEPVLAVPGASEQSVVGIVLEDAGQVFGQVQDTGGIQLESPDPTRDLGVGGTSTQALPTQATLTQPEPSRVALQSPPPGVLLTKTKPLSALLTEESAPAQVPSRPVAMEAATATATLGVPTATIALAGMQGEATATSGIPQAGGDRTSISLPSLEFTGMNVASGQQEPTIDFNAGAPGAPPGSEPSLVAPTMPRMQAPSPPADDEPPVDDSELASEMPYLFSKAGIPPRPGQKPKAAPDLAFAQPLGDAVVPGGAAQTPDSETLKKYLLLREQDVAVLSSQLKESQEQIRLLESQVKTERHSQSDLERTVEEQKRRIADFDREKQEAMDALSSEITELKFELRARSDKGRSLDSQMREAKDEIERVKERVRSDIRKIRVREKELENRLELIKKDSEALLAARESKIIELKRKIDLLEFNMDLLQDQYGREKEVSADLRERLAKAAQVVRVAGGLLHHGESGGGMTGGENSGEEEGGQKAS